MSGRGEVSLGDLVRSFAGLRPADTATAAAVARLLGQETRTPADAPGPRAPEPSEEAPEPPHGETPPAPHLHDAYDGAADPIPPPQPPAPSADRPDAVRLTERALDFSLTALHGLRERGTEPPLPDDTTGTPAEPLARSTATAALPHETPWKQGWARGIMAAAVATPVESRELDERALLRHVARQDALRSVPLRTRLTTRRGAQLLLDHGPAMVPFQDDRAWLAELTARVAGRDRVEVLRFRTTPAAGVVRRDPLTREPYRPPQPGTPVVLFSDLGLLRPPFAGGAGAGPDDWAAFLGALTHAGCPVVCVTPYRAADHPAALRRTVAFVPLDRAISLRHARDATARVRRALERT